jgi:hypothetical protein
MLIRNGREDRYTTRSTAIEIAIPCSLSQNDTFRPDRLSANCTICMHRVPGSTYVAIMWLQMRCVCFPALQRGTKPWILFITADDVVVWDERD